MNTPKIVWVVMPVLLLALTLVIKVATGIYILRVKISKVEAGWTEEQVRAHLGDPSDIHLLTPNTESEHWKWRDSEALPARPENFASPAVKKYVYRVPLNPAVDGFGYVILENNRVIEKYFYD